MRKLFGIRPDITPAQLVALLLGAVPQLAILFGVHLSAAQSGALDNLSVVAVGLFFGDAGIRIGRNVAAAATTNAAAAAATAPPAITSVPQVESDELTEDETLRVAGDDEDHHARLVPTEALPTDEEEFAAPPEADR